MRYRKSHNKDDEGACKIGDVVDGILNFAQRRMYATRKTYIPDGTDSERTKRKKKDRVYGSRRTYKAAIERAKRNT